MITILNERTVEEGIACLVQTIQTWVPGAAPIPVGGGGSGGGSGGSGGGGGRERQTAQLLAFSTITVGAMALCRLA